MIILVRVIDKQWQLAKLRFLILIHQLHLGVGKLFEMMMRF
jgi:hypothetical protein